MPAPRIVHREAAALVVIDIQERLSAVMSRRAQVVAVTGRLMRAAALFGWPIILTRQYPLGLGDLDPELRALAAEDAVAAMTAALVDKTTFCCVEEPAFAEALAATGRGQVVLAGMETHICVTQTALALAADGRQTFVVADACCSRDDRDDALALQRMRAEGVVIATSESVMYEAAGRAATDEFRELLRIVKG